MPEQLSFPGLDPVPTDRLFFALLPDEEAATRTEKIAKSLYAKNRLKGRPMASRRLHVSLYSLGDYVGLPNDIIVKARAAASAIAATPFGVAFDRAGSFVVHQRRLPLVLRNDHPAPPLNAFHQALGDSMARNGLGRFVSRRFTPHMTLLYDATYVAPRPVEPVRWVVRDFVLVHSLLGWSKLVPLARWSLRGVEGGDVEREIDSQVN